jgi:hypothetical protein
MNGEFYCSHCDISFYLRWNLQRIEADEDDYDSEERELVADYCPFCGKMTEEHG